MNRDESGWNQEHKRARYPHNHTRAALVAESGCPEKAGCFQIRLVEHMVGEGEDGGQRGVQQIGSEEINRNAPDGPLRTAWIRANDRPPKQERSTKETGVLDFMPSGCAERETKRRRRMPGNE